jgi:hypothetical protein
MSRTWECLSNLNIFTTLKETSFITLVVNQDPYGVAEEKKLKVNNLALLSLSGHEMTEPEQHDMSHE